MNDTHRPTLHQNAISVALIIGVPIGIGAMWIRDRFAWIAAPARRP